MKIVKHEGKRRLFDQSQTLILMDESTLDRIIEDPSQPLLQQEEKGCRVKRPGCTTRQPRCWMFVRKGRQARKLSGVPGNIEGL